MPGEVIILKGKEKGRERKEGKKMIGKEREKGKGRDKSEKRCKVITTPFN